jgi:hypothetical protein
LECWNAGILEKWVLGNWSVGLMGIIFLTVKLKMDNILQQTHYSIIPLFHYSMAEAKTQTSKISHIFIKLKKIRDVLGRKPLP